jgi:hypothetical protein
MEPFFGPFCSLNAFRRQLVGVLGEPRAAAGGDVAAGVGGEQHGRFRLGGPLPRPPAA